MKKALSIILVLVIGGGLAWLTVRQLELAAPTSQLPKGLEEAALYQGQVVRFREALAGYEAEIGALPSLEGKAAVAALTGENRLRKRYLDSPRLRFDAAGAPVDPWGRVYRFEVKDGRAAVVERALPQLLR